MKSLFSRGSAFVPIRGIHLDLKGVPPTPSRLMELLDIMKLGRFNAVLVEWEDSFPWKTDKRFQSPTAYSMEQVGRFQEEAERRGIMVIPLVQCLGHMETPLSLSGYEHLREVSDFSGDMNPLADGARELVEQMVDDVLEQSPHVRYFHLGGDEAWDFGTHSDTQAFIEQYGKGALYLHHVEPILKGLNKRGVRPILWHDMMISWDDDSLKRLGEQADLMVWQYVGHPYHRKEHCNQAMLERFAHCGIKMWGASAYKGADGTDVDLPNVSARLDNAQGWAEVAAHHDMAGLIATGWSRYSTHLMQCEPIDAALDVMIHTGVIFHDGERVDGGHAACIEALKRLGKAEYERFIRCQKVMQRLSDYRKAGWTNVRLSRELISLSSSDERRRGTGKAEWQVENLNNTLRKLDDIAEETRLAFEGLIESCWIEAYLTHRIEPLRDEYRCLEQLVKQG